MLTESSDRFERQQANFRSITEYPLLHFPGDGSFQARSSYFTLAPQMLPYDEQVHYL